MNRSSDKRLRCASGRSGTLSAALLLLAALFNPGPGLRARQLAARGEASRAKTGPAAFAGSTASSEYIIGPGDVLAIDVWKQPDVSKVLPVRPDGRISLPLIGDFQASGMTPISLQVAIATKLKEYISNPEVNVVVQEIKSRSFNVVGKVMKPGEFDLNKPTSVLDAIALAGGFQDFAKSNKIYVLRRTASGSRQMLPFNYKKVHQGPRSRTKCRAPFGDTLVVP